MMEQYINRLFETRLQAAMENFVERNEVRLKELSIIQRVVTVEEELKTMRQSFELKFDAVQKTMDTRFDAVQKTMDARFEAVDTRFDAAQRETNARFEAVNARFSATQWMIGLFVGIPGFIFALSKVLEFLN